MATNAESEAGAERGRKGGPFEGEGEMRALCRELDWSETPLGPVDSWSPVLRTIVRAALDSPFPINLWCGPELVLVYNDAYRHVLGSKHPRALGRSGRDVWAEIWPSIAPMFEQIRSGGPPVFAADAPFVIRRAEADDGGNGEPNAWFTFSLSPVRDEDGAIAAFLNIVSESTARVQAERARERALADAERAEARLLDVFAQAPSFLAVLRGPQHVFEYVNNAYYQVVGYRELVGRPLGEALPEVREQGFVELLDNVLTTGEAYVGREVLVRVARGNGEPEPRFVDFVYYPITEFDGQRSGVVAHGYDVTEHVLARREAQRARAEAEQASQAKGVFLASMSHEIRTPINAVMGYADLLDAGVAGPLTERQGEYVRRIRSSSMHLLGLVNDVLDFSKIEAGQLVVRHMPVSARSIVTAALQMVAPEIEARGHELVEDLSSADSLRLLGDEDRVRQILLNLLSNAIKFTPPGGRISVRARHLGETLAAEDLPRPGPWIAIDVEDTGPGIPPEQYPRIFEPFVQVEEGHTRSAGGTGLGLSISRRLARMMDGELTVESAVGKGSRFTLWLVPADGEVPAEPSIGGSATGSTLPGAEVRGNGQLAAIETIGRLLLAAAEQLEDEFVSRLRSDPLIEDAGALTDTQLADHAAAYLATLAKALIAIGISDAQLLTDSEEIQTTITRRHGRQRRRLGWTRAALRREFGLLHDVLDSFLRRAVQRDTDRDPVELLGVLHRLLSTGEEQSVGAFDRAGGEA